MRAKILYDYLKSGNLFSDPDPGSVHVGPRKSCTDTKNRPCNGAGWNLPDFFLEFFLSIAYNHFSMEERQGTVSVPITLYCGKRQPTAAVHRKGRRARRAKPGMGKEPAIFVHSAVKKCLERKGIENGKKENIGANNGN